MTTLADRLEAMLTDIDGVPAPPRPPIRLRAYAVHHTWTALRLLRTRGWGPAHHHLRDLSPGPRPLTHLAPAVAIRLARREVLYSQLTLRVTHPDALCLPRSLSLATYLSALGLPAEVIVARERTCTNPRYSFHSWTELYGEVLNDNPDVTLGFAVLQRVRARALTDRAPGVPA
ncbi:lasso peptide biosynthesis protein [Nocardia sp. NPDC003482]|uniref:lasso peptide biosynthesis protein n=1 Tax=Nocardia sp. NPDC004068 TaxID=3364303 RepID=UPI0036941DD0